MSKPVATIGVMALLLAGCAGGPGVSPTAPASASESPPATAAPSPVPVDVAAAFKSAYSGMKTGILTMAGQVTVGAVQVKITGTTTVSGPDSVDTTTSTVGGVVTTTEHAQVAGVRYVKPANGPWLTDTSPAPSSELGNELTRLAKLVTDAGAEQRGSITVHRLTTPPGSTLDPAAFGVGGGAATNVVATVVFFALEDGTPSAVTIQLSWSQPGGTATVEGRLAIDIAFSQLGVPHLVKAPAHVWPVFVSKTNGFSMAYPDDDSTTTIETVDYFDAPSGAFVGVGRDKIGTATLNGIVTAEIGLIKKNYKTSSVKNEATTLGGATARLLTATGTHPGLKTKVVLYEVIAAKGTFIYYVFWIGPPEIATTELVTFRQMLATFAIR